MKTADNVADKAFDKALMTPLRKQYLDIKAAHDDAILLFRIGDFYEAFDEDARIIARELDIVLTSKPMGKSLRVPLAGVPHHSLDRHLATLINRGFRIAICEQTGDELDANHQSTTSQDAADNLYDAAHARQNNGSRNLMARRVVRVLTPGTVLESGLLLAKANNYIAAVVRDRQRAGIAYADVSTGDFFATETEREDQHTLELERIRPAELLVPNTAREQQYGRETANKLTRCADEIFEYEWARRIVLEHFNARSLQPFGLHDHRLAVSAVGALLHYLRDTQNHAGNLQRLRFYHVEEFMRIDAQTVRSLEIFESAGGAQSLLTTIDRTCTPMGGRLLRRWLRQPSMDVVEIASRQRHVAWFCANERARGELNELLKRTGDIERSLARARAGVASPQETLQLAGSLEQIPAARRLLQSESRAFGAVLTALPVCERAVETIRRSVALPEAWTKTAGVIRDGYSEELDRLRKILRDGRTVLAEMEQRERARTGIKSLRVGFNKVFGYFIEVTRPNLHLVPADYTRKQTLANAERFVTLELKEYESLVTNAGDRVAELETSLFRRVLSEISGCRQEILGAAATLAYLDAICAFAINAVERNYACPQVTEGRELIIEEGRHPVLETLVAPEAFVSNDVRLGVRDDKAKNTTRIALITGPNMSGKSTYLRQTALIVLLAQVGSFVPANSATVGICDRIFNRSGLYDRLGAGESTFMTEMTETAEILHQATNRSLIIFDELGRGTSTYDGLAVARAVLEYLHNHPRLQAKTLFATHYHELTELVKLLPAVENFYVEIAERDGEIEFLHRIKKGSAGKSYGVYAAKLAGLPRPVVRRAEQLLGEYESAAHASQSDLSAVKQITTSTSGADGVIRELCELDLDAMSPVEALMKLFEMRRAAEAIFTEKSGDDLSSHEAGMSTTEVEASGEKNNERTLRRCAER